MKKTLLLLFTLLIISCKYTKTKESYYIVAKTYVQGHMCHSEYNNIEYAGMFGYIHTYTHVHHTPHKHKYIEPQYTLHIANKNNLLHINVSEDIFIKYEVKDKILY